MNILKQTLSSYIWEKSRVTADATQTDEELQYGSQVVAPIFIAD